MNNPLTMLLISLLICATGCHEPQAPAANENFGHIGKGTASDSRGSHDHVLLRWQKNRRILLLGIVQHEKDPIAPRFFVIGRLQPLKPGFASSSELSFGQSNDSSGLEMRVSASEGPTIKYHLSNDTDKEQLTIGDDAYSFKDGRVFLLDQSTDPASVQQINADWDLLFANEKTEFTRDEYIAALKILAGKHEKVREFLAAFEVE